MKSKFLSVLILFSSLLASCTTIQQTIYLQDVEVMGPMNPPPIKITNIKAIGDLTISPRLTVNNFSEISGHVKNEDYKNSTRDSLYTPIYDNLIWKFPSVSFGLDLDLAVTNHFAIAGGLSFATINESELIGGSLGVAFFAEKEESAVRFDAGVLIQEMYYDIKSIVVTTENDFFNTANTRVSYYRDKNKNSDVNLYAMFTYNTKNKLPMNFVLSLAYYSQTLFHFNPNSQTDITFSTYLNQTISVSERTDATSSFLSATPGLYLDFDAQSRLILGARLIYNVGDINASRHFFILPVLQVDIQF